MMKVMEWEVYVEKDMLRRSLKVWVESRGENPDEMLNWYFKDGEMLSQVRKIHNVMSEGLIPMFTGPMGIMQEVIEKMAEAYPSRLFVKSEVYETEQQKNREMLKLKDAEIKKWEERFDRTLGAALENRQPILATLESTEDELAVLGRNRPRPAADKPVPYDSEIESLVDRWPFGWRDVIGYSFAGVFYGGIVFAIGRAFRWW